MLWEEAENFPSGFFLGAALTAISVMIFSYLVESMESLVRYYILNILKGGIAYALLGNLTVDI